MRLQTFKHKRSCHPQGFTLIELLFAMTAFSIMLVVAVSGFLNAMWIYNQATISRDNQQQVRSIVDAMGRNIRTATYANVPFIGAPVSGGLPPVVNGYSSLCLEGSVDGTIYYYKKNDHLFSRKVQSCRPTDVGQYLNAEDPSNPGVPLSEEKDLVTGGAAVRLWSPYTPANLASQPNTGFGVWQVDQPILPPATQSVQSVRLEFGLRRGGGNAVTARERQFGNDFSINSTFYLRNLGS